MNNGQSMTRSGCLGALFGTDQAPNTPVDLSRFGVVGDGSTDDTAALQRALDAGRGQVLDGGGRTFVVRTAVRGARHEADA